VFLFSSAGDTSFWKRWYFVHGKEQVAFPFLTLCEDAFFFLLHLEILPDVLVRIQLQE
jgi:hypothetical protein